LTGDVSFRPIISVVVVVVAVWRALCGALSQLVTAAAAAAAATTTSLTAIVES